MSTRIEEVSLKSASTSATQASRAARSVQCVVLRIDRSYARAGSERTPVRRQARKAGACRAAWLSWEGGFARARTRYPRRTGPCGESCSRSRRCGAPSRAPPRPTTDRGRGRIVQKLFKRSEMSFQLFFFRLLTQAHDAQNRFESILCGHGERRTLPEGWGRPQFGF